MHCNPCCTLVINDISRTKPCVGKVEEQIDRKGGGGAGRRKEKREEEWMRRGQEEGWSERVRQEG